MKILKIIFQVVLVAIFIATIVFAQSSYKRLEKSVKYSGLRVNIGDSSTVGFVSRQDIAAKISTFQLKKDVTPIKDVPLAEIEAMFKNNPYINRVEVYSDITGHVNVDVEQFVPEIRIIDSDGISYLLDNSYKVVQQRRYVNMELPVITQSQSVIPLQYLLRVQDIQKDSMSKKQKEAYNRIDLVKKFVEKLDDNDLWKSLISQVNINGDGDIELIPRLGVHLILFCNIDLLEDCDKYFDKLSRFYKSQTNNGLWTEYSRVNLKYEGQVVCKKIK